MDGMGRQFRLEVSQLSDVGQVRDHNEDFLGGFETRDSEALKQRGRLYVVADGMGGHQAGEVASQYAVEQVLHSYYNDDWLDAEANVRQAIERANAEIHAEANQNPLRHGMGTTLVATVIHNDEVIVANVGNSRAYLIRSGDIRQLSRDHSWVEERVAEGLLTPEGARNHPSRNIITRSLGGGPEVEVDIFREHLQQGDVVVLCSDGLHGVVEDREIAEAVTGGRALQAAAELIALANQRGGPDNITISVIQVREPVSATELVSLTPPGSTIPTPTRLHRPERRRVLSIPALAGLAVLLLVSLGLAGHYSGVIDLCTCVVVVKVPANTPTLPSPHSDLAV